MATTIDEGPAAGTVVRDRIWGGTQTGIIVRRDTRTVFVAWGNSSIEDELDASQVEVWTDVPAMSQFRGGIEVAGR